MAKHLLVSFFSFLYIIVLFAVAVGLDRKKKMWLGVAGCLSLCLAFRLSLPMMEVASFSFR